jgi:hypothetical protein
VAGSFWGCHASERRDQGFAESWHSTAGKVEITALAHNDAFLILDETKRAGHNDKARAETVVSVSFSLAEAAISAKYCLGMFGPFSGQLTESTGVRVLEAIYRKLVNASGTDKGAVFGSAIAHATSGAE